MGLEKLKRVFVDTNPVISKIENQKSKFDDVNIDFRQISKYDSLIEQNQELPIIKNSFLFHHYSANGIINFEHSEVFPIADDSQSPSKKLYNEYEFDSRKGNTLERRFINTKNPYFGSKLDDGKTIAAGKWNWKEPYAFGIKPEGEYFSIEDIFSRNEPLTADTIRSTEYDDEQTLTGETWGWKKSYTFGVGNKDPEKSEGDYSPILDKWSNELGKLKSPFGELYNYDHTGIKDDRLNIRYGSKTFGSVAPFIVSEIPKGAGKEGGRLWNMGNRAFPLMRGVTDAIRIGKYLTTPSGLLFLGKQFVLQAFNPQLATKVYNPLSLASGIPLGAGVKLRIPRHTETGLKFLSSIFEKIPGVASRDDSVHHSIDGERRAMFNVKKDLPLTGAFAWLEPQLAAKLDKTSTSYKKIGDFMTLEEISKELPDPVTSEEKGMPLYFKDLRDNKIIVFRGYIDGLTEDISPTWTSTSFVGRSEPVYLYEETTRTVTFTLHLFAGTEDELDVIYKKMNRLTSLCYPQYMKDEYITGKTKTVADDASNAENDKTSELQQNAYLRMKPPLTRFRMGELFGGRSEKYDLLGFIDSLAWTYPDNSPWETQQGKRVPKYVTVTIIYKVIHLEVPSLSFADGTSDHSFYGITNKHNNG